MTCSTHGADPARKRSIPGRRIWQPDSDALYSDSGENHDLHDAPTGRCGFDDRELRAR